MKFIALMVILLTIEGMTELHAQWKIMNLDANSYTYNNVIKFKNDSVGLFTSDNSFILKTEDAGETWSIKALKTKIDIFDFQFIGDSNVFAIGDNRGFPESLTSKLIRSSDNGETWDSISGFMGKQLNSLWFFNNDSGLLSGYDGIYRTKNAGFSWDTVWGVIRSGYKYGTLEQLYFPTKQIGYAIGEGRTHYNDSHLFDHFVLKTTDSGITWDSIETFKHPLTSIYFLNQDTGFIGTESNTCIILKTTDGGNTWNEYQVSQNYNTIESIQFISDKTGFATGSPSAFITEGSTSFFISGTTDGGETWESYDTVGIPLNSIYYINDTIGFVAGMYRLIMKSDESIYGLPKDYPWELVLSINESLSEDPQIEVFPNPTNGIVYIRPNYLAHEIKSIYIMGSTGYVINMNIPHLKNLPIPIDLSDCAAGLYLIQIAYSDRNETIKVIKK